MVIVSVYQSLLPLKYGDGIASDSQNPQSVTTIWIAGRLGNTYVNAIKLRGLLDLHLTEVSIHQAIFVDVRIIFA